MLQQQQQQHTAAVMMSITGREASFAQSSWEVGLRSDKRQFNQLRVCEFSFPTAETGICEVKLGKTICIARVTCKLVDPSEFSPKHGFLDFNVVCNAPNAEGSNVSLAASSRTAATQEIQRILEALFKTSKAIDTESLCVLPGRKVWSLSTDVTVLNDAGNATDASVWAAACALQHFRRPELTIRNDEVTVHPPHERDPVPLNIHHIPITVSSVLTGAMGSPTTKYGSFVVDPTPAELLGGSGLITVSLNKELQVCAVLKNEGEDATYPTIKQAIATAKGLVPLIFDLMDKAMKDDEALRKEATLAQFQWAQKRTGVKAAEAPPTSKADEDSLPAKRSKAE